MIRKLFRIFDEKYIAQFAPNNGTISDVNQLLGIPKLFTLWSLILW